MDIDEFYEWLSQLSPGEADEITEHIESVLVGERHLLTDQERQDIFNKYYESQPDLYPKEG